MRVSAILLSRMDGYFPQQERLGTVLARWRDIASSFFTHQLSVDLSSPLGSIPLKLTSPNESPLSRHCKFSSSSVSSSMKHTSFIESLSSLNYLHVPPIHHSFVTTTHAHISCSITSAPLTFPLVESRKAFNVDPCATTARPACLGRYFAAEQRPSTTSIGPDVLVSDAGFQIQTTAECPDPIKYGKVVRDAEAPHLNVQREASIATTIPDSPLHRAFVVASVARLESMSRDARRDIYAFLWCCQFPNQCLTGSRREQKDGTSRAPLLHATQAAETG